MNKVIHQNNPPVSIMLNLAIMVFLAAVFQGCQKPIEDKYYVEKLDQLGTVDLDNIDWSQARLLNEFKSPWQQAATNTEFRALYDHEFLYFKFEVKEKNILVYQDQDTEQEVVRSERVEMFFRQNDQLNPYYCLEMDAAGRKFDNKVRHYRQYNPEWSWPEGQLQIQAERNHDGYSLTGKISLKSLKELGLLKENKLQVGLYRGHCLKAGGDDDSSFHWISWIDPKTDEPDFHVANSFGRFELVE